MTTSLKDLLAGLQRDYVAALPKKRESLHSLWKSDNIPDLQTEYHKLKGTGRTYGLPEISQLGEAMEMICLKDRSLLNQTVPFSLSVLERIQASREAGQPYQIENDPDFLKIDAFVVDLSGKSAA